MKDLDRQREVIRQYLLGELDDERRQGVEERLMTDGDYRDEVLMVEDELVEDYLIERLSPEERVKFEQHYLSAPRQQKNLKLTRVLIKAAQAATPLPPPKKKLRALRDFLQSSSPRMRFATVSLIVLALLGAGVIFQAWRLRLQQAELSEEVAQLNTPQSILSADSSVHSVTLQPLNLRDRSALPRITITPAVKVIQLRVPIPSNSFENYKVGLSTIEGEQIVEFEVKRQAGEVLIVQLPAQILKPNDYVLSVQRLTENLGEYSFRVLQQ